MFQEGDGVVPEEAQRKNPNALKFTGGPAEVLLPKLSFTGLHVAEQAPPGGQQAVCLIAVCHRNAS